MSLAISRFSLKSSTRSLCFRSRVSCSSTHSVTLDFLGTRLNVTQVARLYVEVFDQLLVLQPEAFQGTKLGERIQLTSEPGTLRQAVRIAEGFFVEGNIDSTSKFERLKLALSELGMEEELFIKFA
jgi:hypothetical protein